MNWPQKKRKHSGERRPEEDDSQDRTIKGMRQVISVGNTLARLSTRGLKIHMRTLDQTSLGSKPCSNRSISLPHDDSMKLIAANYRIVRTQHISQRNDHAAYQGGDKKGKNPPRDGRWYYHVCTFASNIIMGRSLLDSLKSTLSINNLNIQYLVDDDSIGRIMGD
ncbi:hypothetical protein Cgig2_015405 [Carnegiea gigantea]|uniref:Uncharacterized protein n=1 Tax=Carnegiea gigantea TaxID=171969 RepID=A0A9Q1K324_9CARY|nr:hypothetical protein Cgig2_015405 [Carnegiea gigantea]